MKIGILYICTGKYTVFWKDFYLSCEKYFIPEAEKEYFVFTDALTLEYEKENPHIYRIYQENLGWPNNTLLRYEMFLKQKEKLEKTDYLFFFNANIVFLDIVTEQEFLPHGNKKLVAARHFGFYKKPVKKFPFESRRASTAYMTKDADRQYFLGGITGGETKAFMDAVRTLDANIKEDFQKKIVATWHDESHWNRYVNDHIDIIKIIEPEYLNQEYNNLPHPPKVIITDKKRYGGYAGLRGHVELRLIINEIKGKIARTLRNAINRIKPQ